MNYHSENKGKKTIYILDENTVYYQVTWQMRNISCFNKNSLSNSEVIITQALIFCLDFSSPLKEKIKIL